MVTMEAPFNLVLSPVTQPPINLLMMIAFCELARLAVANYMYEPKLFYYSILLIKKFLIVRVAFSVTDERTAPTCVKSVSCQQ